MSSNIIELLINKSVHGFTLLHQSVINGYTDSARCLLLEGVDTAMTTPLEIVDHTVPYYPNLTAGDIALCSFNEDMVTMLASHHALVSGALSNVLTEGETALDLCLKPTNPLTRFRKELVSLALDKNDITEPRKRELLNFLLKNNHFLTWPLETGGLSFLHLAFSANNRRVISQLVLLPNWATLCQITNPISHWTLLHVVVSKGLTDLYVYLPTVKINAVTKKSQSSALHMASALKNGAMCVALIQDGADTDLKNQRGERAHDIWVNKTPANPLWHLRFELSCFATNAGSLSVARKSELLALIKKYSHLLTWPLNEERNIFFDFARKGNLALFCEVMGHVAININDLSESKKAKLLRLILVSTDYLMVPLDEDRRTFLHLVFDAKNTIIINELVKYVNWKPLVRVTDVMGRTCLHLAAIHGHAQLCALLTQQSVVLSREVNEAEQLWRDHHPSQENPITLYIERAKRLLEKQTSLVDVLDVEIGRIDPLSINTTTLHLLGNLRKKISHSSFSPTDPMDKKEESVLREVIEMWEQQNCDSSSSAPGGFYATANIPQVKKILSIIKERLVLELMQEAASGFRRMSTLV